MRIFDFFKNKATSPLEVSLFEDVQAKYTPECINKLAPNEVFVFGNNLRGRHQRGAAKHTQGYFGAICGQSVVLQRLSYVILTMQGGVDTIKPYVDDFIVYAQEHPELRFLVTRVGCGIAGFKDENTFLFSLRH